MPQKKRVRGEKRLMISTKGKKKDTERRVGKTEEELMRKKSKC